MVLNWFVPALGVTGKLCEHILLWLLSFSPDFVLGNEIVSFNCIACFHRSRGNRSFDTPVLFRSVALRDTLWYNCQRFSCAEKITPLAVHRIPLLYRGKGLWGLDQAKTDQRILMLCFGLHDFTAYSHWIKPKIKAQHSGSAKSPCLDIYCRIQCESPSKLCL